MSRILVTGAQGQLGSEIIKISKEYPTFDFIFVDMEEMPLEDITKVIAFLDKTVPDIIISAGAYTAVDKAEIEKELADQVNHLAIDTISHWCSNNGSKLIHISTDYIFDGTSKLPYNENDIAAPINWYGETKRRGELSIERNLNDAVIIRTSWVYSEYGNNFVKTMLRLMNERESISVVNDQIGTPTYALDLAKAIMKILTSDNLVPGFFHYSNEGEISWYEFAVEINRLSGLNCIINAVTSDQFPTAAKRPNFSLLEKTKIKKTYNVLVPEWKESLAKCLKILNS
ncbi:dTDP-4-dehydrorhamnose reductase [Aequorivita sublithincola DSM 14238]|uniref:dTDP-4-dehydrorhamnose reductase n=1 Tax=Aequorivita sublithincola (strain DSM 14238 / LMG 21431 / ACAM 643 / 9-3) TaxID=746697 RepID=I3YZE9_AEQSU|nr:dTDP-4-dehydrorhamnose reductase [Aequorivita sublithincola]AFL82367.1 dTDP-4-dehydrorhamnose reductase [Aequorivita sublithincola DSM 14238]